MLTVAEIMTRAPYTLHPDNTLLDARNLMTEHHIRHVPIVSDRQALMGIVSQRDVLASAHSNVFREKASLNQQELQAPLTSIMSHPVHTVDEHASLRGAALHLQQNRVGCLPVVRGNELIGIITDADFVEVAINLMEQLEEVEPEDLEEI